MFFFFGCGGAICPSQFRLIENKLGLPPRQRLRYSSRSYCSYLANQDADIVVKAQKEPSLFDLVNNWLERTPFLKTEKEVLCTVGPIENGTTTSSSTATTDAAIPSSIFSIATRENGSVQSSSETIPNNATRSSADLNNDRSEEKTISSVSSRSPSRTSTPTPRFNFWSHYQSAVDRMFAAERMRILARYR